MKLFVLLILAVFASETNENGTANDPKDGKRSGNNEENLIVVKIEDDEYDKVNKKSKFIGVCYHKNKSKWRAQRWSKNEKKQFSSGFYDDEETAAHASDTLARKLMENGDRKLKLNFPDNYTEVYQEERRFTSKFIGVSYHKNESKWGAQRWSKNENKRVYNGYHDDEETAAHASDTLARKLMRNGDRKLKLNYPDNYTEVYPKKESSKFIGVSYNKDNSKWYVQRWNRYENKNVLNGCYGDEETAAHASDTFARQLMKNGEKKLKLNFPDNYTEVYPQDESSKFIGVCYHKNESKWGAQRWSKNEKKQFSNGCYDDEETTAHASDTLAKKLMENGEPNHKMNFPDNYTELYPKKESSKFIGVSYNKRTSKWYVQRWNRYENKRVSYGYYDDEETAAHASDTLAIQLMENVEKKLKVNFLDDYTEENSEKNQKKRKRQKEISLEHPQNN